MTCLASCTRQDNQISSFTYKFPSKMFLNSPELVLLIRKLSWSCQSSNPKRQLLDLDYPRLCPLYDRYIYSNQQINNFLASDKPLNVPVNKFLWDINIPDDDWTIFEQELMLYAFNNLVKLTAYIESPYVTVYETTEVFIWTVTLWDTILSKTTGFSRAALQTPSKLSHSAFLSFSF